MAVVLARILHGVGTAQLAPNYCRTADLVGTIMLVVLGACYGLTLED